MDTRPAPRTQARPGPVRPRAAARALRAGAGLTLAAAVVHALPAVTCAGALRRALLPQLSGVGLPGGVALTFDDGPDPDGTPAVLDALDRLGWRATFFLLGSQVARFPQVARQVAAAGHEVAVHGELHRNHLTRTPGALVRDVRTARDRVREVTGQQPRWYRPPYGVVSAGTLHAVRAARLTPVLWTAWGRDWTATTPERVVTTLLRDLRDGGTLLLHDSDCTSTPRSWQATAACLPLLADALDRRGLAVRTLAEHRPLAA